METILSVENLSVVFHTYAGTTQAVKDLSFSLGKGEILGIVGESGSGKSVTASSLLGLIPKPPGEITSGRILFTGKDIVQMDEKDLRAIRGNTISMIFQDPMTSLNPALTVGLQVAESFMLHQGLNRKQAMARAIDILRLVGIPASELRATQYPHQLSGGMRQRIMIAIALSCNPQILIADEPTTALDVTIQAQIIELMKALTQQLNTSIILISHDLGVVAGLCSRVLVMYAGQIVEAASVDELYSRPQHPYTRGLLRSLPRLDEPHQRLQPIAGQPPDLLAPHTGCAFLPRCRYKMEICRQAPPLLQAKGRESRCWLSHPASPLLPDEVFKEGDLA